MMFGKYMLNEGTSNVPLRLKIPLQLPNDVRLTLNSFVSHIRLRSPSKICLLLAPPASSHRTAPRALLQPHPPSFGSWSELCSS